MEYPPPLSHAHTRQSADKADRDYTYIYVGGEVARRRRLAHTG